MGAGLEPQIGPSYFVQRQRREENDSCSIPTEPPSARITSLQFPRQPDQETS